MPAAVVFIVGALASSDAAITAAGAVMVALIGAVATVSAVVIQSNKGAKKKGDAAVEAVTGVEVALETLRDELDRAHDRIDLVEEREAECLETVTSQTHEILRLRSLMASHGVSADLLDP